MSRLFIENYLVSNIDSSINNARKISEEKLHKLKKSIDNLGMIRPLIIRKDGRLISGNQRTSILKKYEYETVPVFQIENISLHDEINFTLLINSLETSMSEVEITSLSELEVNKFRDISPELIKINRLTNAAKRRDIADSIIKYGNWGTVVVNKDGVVIFNSDYATVAKLLKLKLKCFLVDEEKEMKIKEYLFDEYGVYSFEHLGLKSYPQTYAQLQRSTPSGDKGHRSRLYENTVIPNITKEQRGMDFGAGKMQMARYLRDLKYDILAYEPFYKTNIKNKVYFDIEAIKSHIEEIRSSIDKNGLFDYVVCDSVLNSVINKDFEHKVLSTCSSLLKEDGTLYISCRDFNRLKTIIAEGDVSKKATDNSRRTYTFDENNFYMSFRNGLYTFQKFHTKEELRETLHKYFKEVGFIEDKKLTDGTFHVICKKPIRFEDKLELKSILDEEFNMEYPNEYKHNSQAKLVELILKNNIGGC